MPFRPKCKFEYIPSVTRCPECGEELVDSLPREAEEPDEEGFEQVLLCTIAGELHTSLLRNALVAAGIPSRTVCEGSNLLEGAPTLAGPSARVRIYVNRRDLLRTSIIYRDHETRRKP